MAPLMCECWLIYSALRGCKYWTELYKYSLFTVSFNTQTEHTNKTCTLSTHTTVGDSSYKVCVTPLPSDCLAMFYLFFLSGLPLLGSFSLSLKHTYNPHLCQMSIAMCSEKGRLSCSILLWLSLLIDSGDVGLGVQRRPCSTLVWGCFSLLCGQIMIEHSLSQVLSLSNWSSHSSVPMCITSCAVDEF